MVRKSWQLELEVAAHIATTVRKQSEINTVVHLLCPLLFSLGSQSVNWYQPVSVRVPTAINLV